ncbi:MBL fold metallo-hydrolase [Acidaminobacter sp. JC074]|uniref:MBL fold metallo-hydrolase n=1 Tax=Acidaminobacter sp. JC074 TaxID=2530199 RepID=UPI001F1160EC|nr:MBL fold metallo-hydrolase [Acidaminobacter sp. JC074]MCH4890188.1 MBL fold metallo-hydrolase [Acidaminobacter sp. JC074]
MKKLIIMISLISFLILSCQPQEKNTTKIEFVRNATMKIEYAGKTFLTDPMLADQAAYPGFLNNEVLANPTVGMPVDIDTLLKNVEFTLVTHTHIPEDSNMEGPSDHFDAKAVQVLDKDMPVYIQPFDEAGLKRKGFTNLQPISSQIKIDNITITRIIGVHADVEFLLPIVGDSSAYVLEAEGEPTIFWTGDNLLTDDMKEAIKSFKPDIVIVHSGGASLPIDAEGNMAQLVMNAEDTIEISKLVPNAKIVAIHMESLDHCPVTREELREKALKAGIKERMIIPEDGQIIEF